MRCSTELAAGLLLLVGCGPVLPAGERVLGDQVPAVVIEGAGGGFGRAVAVSAEGRVAVAAPDDGVVRVWSAAGALLWEASIGVGAGETLAWQGEDALLAVAPGGQLLEVVAGAEPRVIADEAELGGVAICPDGVLAVGPGPMACGAAGVLSLSCADGESQEAGETGDGPGCEVRLDGEVVDRVSPGGAVAFADGQPCWSEVESAVDDAPGEVRCRVNGAVEVRRTGITGEHLGQSLSGDAEGGLVSGRFTRWTGTPRARVLPLSGTLPDGAEAWVVDRAADASPLVVAAGGGVVAVGVPGYSAPSPQQGRLYLVALPTPDLP